LVQSQKAEGLARRLGLFDATMLVMGGIIGSGIFMNPAVTARRVHTTFFASGCLGAGWTRRARRRIHLGGVGNGAP